MHLELPLDGTIDLAMSNKHSNKLYKSVAYCKRNTFTCQTWHVDLDYSPKNPKALCSDIIIVYQDVDELSN